MPVDFQSSLASLLRSFAMVASAVQLAKRALVSLLLTLAQQYSVQIQLKREDDDNLVEAAFRKVVKKTHPDKGGKLAGQQRLQSTRERWRALKTARPTDRARPKVSSDLLPVQVAEPSSSKPYFIMSSSVLLQCGSVSLGFVYRLLARSAAFLGRIALVCFNGRVSVWKAAHSHHVSVPLRFKEATSQ